MESSIYNFCYEFCYEVATADPKGNNSNSLIMNLGSGKGHTVLDIINIIQNKLKVKVNYTYGPRRSGDSDTLVADIYLARLILNYNPKYTIEDIVETAYKWHIKKEKEN